jgi:hypothetical protein
MGIAVCRGRGGALPPLLLILFLFCFFVLSFVAPSPWGRGVPPLPGMDIGVMASSVPMAIVLGTVVLQVETKMVSTRMTMATTNEMRHGAPSTPPSDPCLT